MSGMQEGMRGYFDELSGKRDFLGIQEVLVKEINNSDSRKYAILTTTDSFYRYKEAVRELIAQTLSANEIRRMELERERLDAARASGEESAAYRRSERSVQLCEEAIDMLCLIEREFDRIERRYNKLIEQKTIFASRAAARIRYLLREGAMEEDRTVALVNLLGKSSRKEEIAEELAKRMKVSAPFRVITGKSFYSRRGHEEEAFRPVSVRESSEGDKEELQEFVLKPLYTEEELRQFRRKSEKDGVFEATQNTVQSVEDLEKLFFLWQEATERNENLQEITVGKELTAESGLRFSALRIEEKL